MLCIMVAIFYASKLSEMTMMYSVTSINLAKYCFVFSFKCQILLCCSKASLSVSRFNLNGHDSMFLINGEMSQRVENRYWMAVKLSRVWHR